MWYGNLVQGKLPKIYVSNPNEVSKYEVDRIPTSHFLSPNEASNIEIGLHPIECGRKGSHGNPQTI